MHILKSWCLRIEFCRRKAVEESSASTNLVAAMVEQAIQTISLYYPVDRFPQKTLYALEEILARE